MGKRENSDKEEYIARKIKKLERKIAKVRRRISSSVESLDPVRSEAEVVNEPMSDDIPEPVVQITEESHQINNVPVESEVQPEVTLELELDPSILNILGDEPANEDVFSKAIHKDIASRWSDILINGLKEDVKKDIIKNYNIPKNPTLARNPLLNPEIKAAVNEIALKRDIILAEKQKQLACVITCLAEFMTSMLACHDSPMDNKETLKLISDAGRILCHVHYSETSARKNFLLACLNKEVRDNIKDLKRDHLLFGSDLSEKLKCMKAINKTGVEMRPAASKTKAQPKGKQAEASTSRALNWRGPPPPAPRREFTRPSSTAGGRKQPTGTARGSGRGRRDLKPRSKSNRR